MPLLIELLHLPFPGEILQSQGLVSLICWGSFILGLKTGIFQVGAGITTEFYIDTFYLMTSIIVCNEIEINVLDRAGDTFFFTHNLTSPNFYNLLELNVFFRL
jgi:hypothetical protein